MAKNKSYVTVFMVLLAGITALTGCAGEGAGSASDTSNVDEGLSEELAMRIIQDYSDFRFPSMGYGFPTVYIVRHYGTFNGCVVSFIWAPPSRPLPLALDRDPVIAGVRIGSVHPIREPLAWKDGRFNNLQVAYEQGWLTRDDLIKITEYFPDGLDMDLERRILRDFKESGGEREYDENKDITWLRSYYGTYNGYVVVRLSLGSYQTDWRPPANIGGFKINIYPHPIIAWKDGQVYELEDAYDLGLLTQDDISSIVDHAELRGEEGHQYYY